MQLFINLSRWFCDAVEFLLIVTVKVVYQGFRIHFHNRVKEIGEILHKLVWIQSFDNLGNEVHKDPDRKFSVVNGFREYLTDLALLSLDHFQELQYHWENSVFIQLPFFIVRYKRFWCIIFLLFVNLSRLFWRVTAHIHHWDSFDQFEGKVLSDPVNWKVWLLHEIRDLFDLQFSFCEFEYVLKEKRKTEMDFALHLLQFELFQLRLLFEALEGLLYSIVIHVDFVDPFAHFLDIQFSFAGHDLCTTLQVPLQMIVFDWQIFDVRVKIGFLALC